MLGFELLSYSPNINYLDTDEECMTEVRENLGTLKRAWEWADKKGLLTFTWHWFSPLGGRSKSFFTKNTDFDAGKTVIDGTPENAALISDMDMMAGILRPFCDQEIPILWRPFHEGDGNWFKLYHELLKITAQPKITLIGETGSVPDIEAVHHEKIGWASYMTWSKEYCLNEKHTDAEYLKKVYASPYAVTKEDLPILY